MKKTGYVNKFLGIVVLVVLATGCGGAVEDTESLAASQPLIDISDDIVSASAEVVAGEWANLAFMAGAERVSILVEAGDEVKSGDVLALFPENALPQAIVNAQADLVLAQKSLSDLLASDVALAQAEQNLAIAKQAVEDAQKDVIKLDYRRASDDLLDQTQAEIDLANKQVSLAEDAYKAVRNRPDGDSLKAQALLNLTNARLERDRKQATLNWYLGEPSELDAAKYRAALSLALAQEADAQREYDRLLDREKTPEVVAARTRVEALETLLRQARLIAPFNGTVVQLYVNSGEMVSPGSPVLLLADLSTLQVKTTDLNEVDVARIEVGDQVKVSFDALPDTVVTGKVGEISLKNAVGSGVYYDVFVTLDEIPEGLRWGMSAFVEIQVSK
jgi:multidrug resistance efflux pump